MKTHLLLITLTCIGISGKLSNLTAAEPASILTDISYKTNAATDYETERCKLDIYLPENRSDFPTLIWFYGGGLQNGEKNNETTVAIAKRFAREGIAVVVPDYRLSPRAKFPAYIEDAVASFAWVKKNIAAHGGDADNIFISGHSAGAYLTAMSVMDASYLEQHDLTVNDVAGLIPISGQMITHATVRGERGIPETTRIIDSAAPSYHTRAELPPFLNIAGSQDEPARAAENIYFVAAMKAARHQHIEYKEFEGRTHNTIVNQIPRNDDPVAAAIIEFIRQNKR